MFLKKQTNQPLMITLLKPWEKVKSNPNNHRVITLLPILYRALKKLYCTESRYFQVQVKIFLGIGEGKFLDPLQCAYHELLSNINCTFSLHETINYNKETADVVRLWRVIIDSYSVITTSVLYNGKEYLTSYSPQRKAVCGELYLLWSSANHYCLFNSMKQGKEEQIWPPFVVMKSADSRLIDN